MEKFFTEKEIIDIIKGTPPVWYSLPIERNNIIEKIKKLTPKYNIVHCEECKFKDPDPKEVDLYWCDYYRTIVNKGNNFCKHGELKND